ncbi:MAG: radical SAM family heme chaperone HemW [Bacteroidaceae bacterium]|nr:radical SAM family heme chaperone HemW [Bacteroidaceae bacterium]
MPGIYIHVPFCESRCAYCDFYSTTLMRHRSAYVDMVCRELQLRLPELQGAPIETIYLGGGTPSTLTIEELSSILTSIQNFQFSILNSQFTEATLEANPDDLTEEYVQGLRTLPFNRVSIGIQSFHDRTLRLVGRRHTAQEAIEAVHRCQRMGLTNISIDLMYGLPGETLDDWAYSLDQAIALGVPHISAYHLTYEEGTRLWRMKEQGIVSPIDEEQSIRAFELLREKLLAAGYEHYEISNFALPGYHSRHNSSYWQGIPYIGIGPGAHSYDGTDRRWNLSSLTDYIATPEGEDVPHEVEHLTTEERYDERIITELRTARGIDLTSLLADFGDRYHTHCLRCATPYINRGQLVRTDDNHLRLTPESIFISDAVMRDLLY